MLGVGQKLPAFQLQNQNGELRRPSDYSGQWLALYVYPKDDTPGCTLQGKSFTEQKKAFEDAGIMVVGVSADDAQSHKAFCDKHSLTVELLADPQARLLKALGVTQSEWKGVQYWDRTTFVVDTEGVIRKVYEKVRPEGHEATLLKDIAKLSK